MADAPPFVEIAQLVAEHHQAVYRYAYRLTGSVHDAEDLVQEVVLIAQRKMGQLRNLEAAKSWLFAILRNCFLKEWRHRHRRPALTGQSAPNLDMYPAAPPSEGVDSDRVQEVLNELPDAARLVVVMFYFEGCSYREIAERLALPIGTVMSRLARAKERFRAIWNETEERTEARKTEPTRRRVPAGR